MSHYTIEVGIPNTGPVGPQGQPGEFGELEAPSDNIIYGRRNQQWVNMTSPANLQVRRGTAAEVAAITPLEGEPLYATDTLQLYIGDGATLGGRRVLTNAEYRGQTSNATITELFLGGGSQRLGVPPNTAMFMFVSVSGAQTNGAAAAHYLRQYAIRRVTTTSQLYSPVVIGTDYASNTALTLDAINNAVRVRVTGVLNQTWNWRAVVSFDLIATA